MKSKLLLNSKSVRINKLWHRLYIKFVKKLANIVYFNSEHRKIATCV